MGTLYRIGWAAICSCMVLTAAHAQDVKYFYTEQECYPLVQFMDMVVNDYGESALFTGNGLTIGSDGNPYNGAVMMFVNQETGTWTLGTMYGDRTVCLSAVGTEFEPYSK